MHSNSGIYFNFQICFGHWSVASLLWCYTYLRLIDLVIKAYHSCWGWISAEIHCCPSKREINIDCLWFKIYQNEWLSKWELKLFFYFVNDSLSSRGPTTMLWKIQGVPDCIFVRETTTMYVHTPEASRFDPLSNLEPPKSSPWTHALEILRGFQTPRNPPGYDTVVHQSVQCYAIQVSTTTRGISRGRDGISIKLENQSQHTQQQK